MSSTVTDALEDAIRRAGEGWIIDSFRPASEALHYIRRVLVDVQQRAHERLGADAPDLTESAIVQEYQRHPSQVKGFFQALGGTRTPDMLLMAWRVIQGLEIKEVQLGYRRGDHFQVRVILESPSGGEDPPYESNKINDFALFRHIGIMEMAGAPVLDGFYPLRIGKR